MTMTDGFMILKKNVVDTKGVFQGTYRRRPGTASSTLKDTVCSIVHTK